MQKIIGSTIMTIVILYNIIACNTANTNVPKTEAILKEGLVKEYDKNGQLLSEGYYIAGKANGWMKWYYEGELVAEGEMKEDQREGKWHVCDVHDKTYCMDIIFKEGKKDGKLSIYYPNGAVWKEPLFRQDQFISEKCWDEQGSPIDCRDKL